MQYQLHLQLAYNIGMYLRSYDLIRKVRTPTAVHLWFHKYTCLGQYITADAIIENCVILRIRLQAARAHGAVP